VDEAEVFEFLEAVGDVVILQGGFGGDLLDVVSAFLDGLEDELVFRLEVFTTNIISY
jgi:hypothetical protein